MVPIVSDQEIRALDAWCCREGGIEAAELMERASLGVTQALIELLPDSHDQLHHCTILIAAGPENNGGDGLCVARQLHLLRPDLRIVVCDVASNGHVSNLRSRARDLVPASVSVITPDELTPNMHVDVVVDAIMGIGGTEYLRDPIPAVVGTLSRYNALRIALDVSTGLNCSTGAVHPDAFRADVTITIQAEKYGFWLGGGPSVTGRVIVAPIGVPDAERHMQESVYRLTQSDVRNLLPSRPTRYSKFDAGRVVVIGGTTSMPGAPSMTAHAALKSGAGLVHLVAPRVHPLTPREVIVHEVPHYADGAISSSAFDQILSVVDRASVVAIGPGVGTNHDTLQMLATIVHRISEDVPIVIDADGLRMIPMLSVLRPNMVLTPHRGEYARMVGVKLSDLDDNPLANTREWCREHQPVLHLKDTPLVTTFRSRSVVTVNGTARMATAGSGDILTGVIAGVIAQGAPPFEGAALGAYVHAEAGTRAAGREDQPIIATDMLTQLPRVLAHSPSV